MQAPNPLHSNRLEETLAQLIDPWRTDLHNHDHAIDTVKKETKKDKRDKAT